MLLTVPGPGRRLRRNLLLRASIADAQPLVGRASCAESLEKQAPPAADRLSPNLWRGCARRSSIAVPTRGGCSSTTTSAWASSACASSTSSPAISPISQRGRLGRRRPQRRDLQLPRAARPSLRSEATASRPQGDTEVIVAPLRGARRRLRAPPARHVRVRAVGRAPPRLLLARDRVGKKPLFYACSDGGAELCLGAAARCSQDRDIPRGSTPRAVDCFLAYGYVPAPLSIFEGRAEAAAGAHAAASTTARADDRRATGSWTTPASSRVDDPRELHEPIRERSARATRRRLIADVPLGAFLSGGIDSSAVVAAMAGAALRR